MSKDFPLVPLHNCILPIERSEVPVAGKIFRQIGVRLWGEGAYERESIDGSQTRYSALSRVETDDIIVNKIWARNGSVAVVPQSLAGSYGSGEFPTFTPIRDKMNPRWFHWFTKTRDFWNQCDEKSRGTSGKNRIRPEKFLDIVIPLPPLEDQQRTVARIEELAARIEEARGLRREVVVEAWKFDKQVYGLIWTEAVKASSSLILLEQFANVIDPQPDHRTPPEVTGGMPYVSIANISVDGKVDVLSARKVPSVAIERQEASFTLRSGDIVLGKIGTIGAARSIAVKERFALSANIVLVQPHRDKILDKMLLALLRSPQMEDQFMEGTQASAQGAFGIKKMRKLLIPLPPLPDQYRIITYLDDLQAKVVSLKQLQSETSAELDALLPSILDKAFKGEL